MTEQRAVRAASAALWRQCRLLLWTCVLGLGLGLGANSARAAAKAPNVHAGNPASYPAPLQVLEGLPASASVEQVAAMDAALFKPLLSSKRYAVSAASPLWLRMTLTPGGVVDGAGWLLEFPTVIVDRYEFFQRDANGAWRMAVAGDFVAHVQWPVDSLRPRFPLPEPSAGAQDIFVRVVHRLPVNLRPVLVSAAEASRRDVVQMLWVGLQLDVIATLVLFCAQMALAYRDRTYAWYAGYLVFTVMATLCYTGVAQRYLWPYATTFASHAIVLSVMGALAFNLQFTRSLFGGLQGRNFHRVARVLVALCLVYMTASPFVEQYDRMVPMFHVITLSVFAFTILCAWRAWRRGVAFGGYWLLVYVPYLVSVALALAESSGLITAPWLPNETPVAAALVEVVVMMLCFNAWSRLRHAETVREQAAKEHDPLTGFLNRKTFRERAARVWQAAPGQRRDLAIIYVTVEPADPDSLNTVEAEELLARSVRLVRTITRDFDTVGRLGRNMLGIVMEGVTLGEALTARLSRLVALGLMRDADDPASMALRFTVAVGSRRSVAGDFAALDAALQALMASDNDTRRPIRFLHPPEVDGDSIPVRRFGTAPGQVQ
ncbi:MAG: 7TM diverse intracellular signaling domain-containing protein [Burkholderiaceae bacterium]|nr:7TM diverse intracellular signaling domain-containing protein [Burkholderiaceae bacterium]